MAFRLPVDSYGLNMMGYFYSCCTSFSPAIVSMHLAALSFQLHL